MKSEDIIRQTYNSHSFAIVIRHSERDIITDVRQSIFQLLTPEGKEMARDFGAKLPTKKPIRLFHSMIERCKQTAECIQEGFKSEVYSFSCHDMLTGFYVYDPESILEDVNISGSYQFISKWFKGVYSETQIMPAVKARQQMIDTFIQNYNEDFLDIYVSHDWNVALLSSLYYNIMEQNYPWPGFMQGAVLKKIEDKYFFTIEAEKDILIN